MDSKTMDRREITRADLMPVAEYAKIRREHRRKLVDIKQKRRVHIGPSITLYFENYDTMWAQVQEMLYIEQGGEEQVEGELSAYNPLIPQGAELVATMMIEIEDEIVRRRTLGRLGHVEDLVYLRFAGHTIKGVPEDDIDRTTPDGKTTVNHRNAGDIVYNLANRSHSEEVVKGQQSGIMLELK